MRDVSSARGIDQPPSQRAPRGGLFGRFTPRANEATRRAERAAREIGHYSVGTEHLLLGILDEGHNLAVSVLASLEIELTDLRAELTGSMGPATSEPLEADLPFTPSAKRAFECTTKEALHLGHNYVGCEHLLLGLLSTEESTASQVLRRMGLELRTTRRAVITALVGIVHTRQARPVPTPKVSDTLEQILRRLDAIEHRLAS